MHNHSRQTRIRSIVAVVIVLAVTLFVWRNWSSLLQSFDVIRTIPSTTFLLAVGFVLITFACAATSYWLLSFKRLAFRELYVVELAAACINRLVPSGIGGIGTHGLYLHKRKHTIAQATAVISVNNLLSLVTHLSVLTVVLISFGGSALFEGDFPLRYLFIGLGAIVFLALLVLTPRVRAKLASFLHNLFVSLRRYAREPHRLWLSALALLGLTAVNVLILSIMAHAVGITLGPAILFIIYSAGVLVGATIPTPGGFAGFEAGLIAGFIAYGVASELAIAAALAFRLVTYWFPLLPGSLALLWTRKLI